MTIKLRLLALLICGLILPALVLRDGRLVLLALPFLAYLLIAALQIPTSLELVARREINKQSVLPNEPVEIHLAIKNVGSTAINLYLDDSRTPSLHILDGQARRRLWLDAGGTTELIYCCMADRGVYRWSGVKTVASDSFELFEMTKQIPAPGELLVRPGLVGVERAALRPHGTLHTPGSISVCLAGSSTDFLGIREYRSGDSLRRLNWRLTARHPHQLFTNEYEREEIADFGFILDARKLPSAHGLDQELFEHSVCGTASLAKAVLKEGNRVALLVFGETMATILPAYGKRQLARIQRSLASARLGANLPFGFLHYFPTRLFPSHSFLIVFSAVSASDYETYARIRSFGYEVLLVSPDPIDCLSRSAAATTINALALRAVRAERIVELKRLMKLGIHVINWQVDTPVETALQQAMRRIARRRTFR